MKLKNSKKLFIIPCSLICLISLASCGENNNAKGGLNTILVTYDAGDGYFSDGITKSSTKVLEVRKGVRFSNLSDSEKPKNDNIHNNHEDDGFKFSNTWKANVDGVEKFISSTNDFTFTKEVTLTACYENENKNFQTDSWDTLIEKAELGFDTLKAYYTTSYTNNGNTFVGLTKKLKYAGEDYLVRVIGEKVDDITKVDESTDNKVACLTFEFENVLPGYAFNVFENSNRYKDSSIQKALNNEVKNNIQSFNTSHLQKVNKKTYKKTSADTQASIETTKEQVFVPSLSELNITKDPNGKELVANDDNEGDTYQYFTSSTGGATEENNRRSKQYIPEGATTGVPFVYWTRSLDMSDTNYSSAWSIYSDGKCGYKNNIGGYDSLDVSKAIGFAPCFCIGITESEKQTYTFETDTWDNVIATANQGFGKLVERYNKDYKKAKDKVELKDNGTTVATVYRKPANSFVGLTRKLNILNDSNVYDEYTVRVIGENHDYMYDPLNTSTATSNKKRAALTFQLTKDYNKKTVWDDAAHGYWDKDTSWIGGGYHSKGGIVNFFYGASTLRHNLSGYGCDSSSSYVWSKPLINRIKFSDNATSPDGSTYIKEVHKQTHQVSDHYSSQGDTFGGRIKEQQFYWHKDCENGAKYITDKLFPLNTFENGTEKYLVYQQKIDAGKVITLKNDFAIQGYAYEYFDYEKIYSPTTHAENILLPELNARRKSDDTTGYATSAGSYLRQAIPCKLGNPTGEAYQNIIKSVVTWNTDGSYKAWETIDNGGKGYERYVRPAFCLGETLESTLRSGGYIA